MRVLIGSEDGCFVKMGVRGMVKVVGLGVALDGDEDEAKRESVEMRKIRESSKEAAIDGLDLRERECVRVKKRGFGLFWILGVCCVVYRR